MKSKTLFIIFLTAIITVFLMLNTDPVDFNFLFSEVPVSKLLVIGVCTLIGFILGYLAGRPKTVISSYDARFEETEAHHDGDHISKEDRDYIS